MNANEQFILPGLGIEPRPGDDRFRLSAHCADEPQRQVVVIHRLSKNSSSTYPFSKRFVSTNLRPIIYRRIDCDTISVIYLFSKLFQRPLCSGEHWRRQLWGTGARAPTPPPRLPASYFEDHSLYRLWRVMRTVFCPVERFMAIGSQNVQKQCDFCAIFINFWPIFVIFCPQFSSGSNYSSQNAGTIANKFQLHTYFRFR